MYGLNEIFLFSVCQYYVDVVVVIIIQSYVRLSLVSKTENKIK